FPCPRHSELGDEARRFSRPAQPQGSLRPGHPDVEQTTLLVDLGRRARLAGRQLLLLQPRQKDRVELEALRSVQRQELNAAPPPPGSKRRRRAAMNAGPPPSNAPASATRRARSV